jgi:hypothetical protein
VQIALYKGKSWTSRAIKFLTRSPYSHAAYLFDNDAAEAARRLAKSGALGKITHYNCGSVIEAWEPGGVRNTRSLSDGHTPGTRVDIFALDAPLNDLDEEKLLTWLSLQLGHAYDFWNVLRFVSKRKGRRNSGWFCSELCFAGLSRLQRDLFRRTQPWEVPPGWISRSPALSLRTTTITQ